MADYDTLESSEESSQPIEVYDFSLGSDSFLYTSSEDDVTVGINTYEPEAISRGAIAQGEEDRDTILEVKVPASNTLVRKYIDIVPGQRASVSIFTVQRNETPPFTQVLKYKGFIQSVGFDDNGHTATIGVRSLEATMSRSIPRFTYQGLCNNFLYDNFCGVNQDLFKHTGEVTAVSGNTITVDGASGFANGYFNTGYVAPSGIRDFRMVIDHTGDVLTLLLPFSVSITGANVNVFAGCDHNINGDCGVKFSNVAKHGGFAFVPIFNPFDDGIA